MANASDHKLVALGYVTAVKLFLENAAPLTFRDLVVPLATLEAALSLTPEETHAAIAKSVFTQTGWTSTGLDSFDNDLYVFAAPDSLLTF